MRRYILPVALAAACGNSAPTTTDSVSHDSTGDVTSAPATTAKPQRNDSTAAAMLAKGSACQRSRQGLLALDCPEHQAIFGYAHQRQSDATSAETCAAFLTDPDPIKRLLAARCLAGFNGATETKVLGWALDAIEAESDPAVQQSIASGVYFADAVTAKLDDRVIADIQKLSADPKTAAAGANLLRTVFSDRPNAPPAKAQQLALAALSQDGTPLQDAALNVALTHIDDRAAVCAALDADLTATAKSWWQAALALTRLKNECLASRDKAIGLALAKAPTTEPRLEVLEDFEKVFDLPPGTRAHIALVLRAATAKVPSEYRPDLDALAKRFSKAKKP